MEALALRDHTLSVEQRPDPVPGPGEVRVSVYRAGLNAADLLQRDGHYPAPEGWPQDIPGLELAGWVTAVGEAVDPAWLDQRVCAIVGAGAQATAAIVPAAHLLHLPENVGLDEAGGFAEAFLTAYDALVRSGRLREGERLLISGASGGVGCAAVQVGRHLGAHVIAVTRHRDHTSALRDLGAHDVVAPSDVRSLEPVDVVLELVGAANLDNAQRILAPFARVVVIGVGGGSRVDLNLLALMGTRATITGSTLRSRSHGEKAEIVDGFLAMFEQAWESGELRVPIAATFELADAATAYDFFSRPGKLGKIILQTLNPS